MMRYNVQYCVHCQTKYSYQMSGYGCSSSSNDVRYCHRCALNVHEALSRIPSTVRHLQLEVFGSEREDVLAELKRRDGEFNDSLFFGLKCRDIGGASFEAKEGAITAGMHTEIIKLKGRKYGIETWVGSESSLIVKRYVLEDIETGDLRDDDR